MTEIKQPFKQKVVLTRQLEYVVDVKQELNDLGMEVEHIQSILIENQTQALQVEQFEADFLIFVSRNAIKAAKAFFLKEKVDLKGKPIFVMGAESAKEFSIDGSSKQGNSFENSRFKNNQILYPKAGTGVKALLALPELQNIKGKTITIFRGETGLDWPKQTFEKLGASVTEVVCYKQTVNPNFLPQLKQVLGNQSSQQINIFIHSGLSAQTVVGVLLSILNEQEYKQPIFLLAGSKRIAKIIKQSGWLVNSQQNMMVANSPINTDMVEALKTRIEF